ncbi:membrane dipeptidase, partial [Piscirickettsia litoralis]|uniref:membrane dipeptidase n=1 Tax=Piscirickettsia litoralis TaxID=1891921 RepID=UPI0019112B75
NMLKGNVNMVSLFHDLGVKQMLLAYNKNNSISGGCMEGNEGITALGREVILEMNRVGMTVDVSHMSCRSSLETMEISQKPVVFSPF